MTAIVPIEGTAIVPKRLQSSLCECAFSTAIVPKRLQSSLCECAFSTAIVPK